jgi:energy-coupling factor transport system substrate-specific component
MSWPLASFLVVGVVLAIGWLAYERSRPSARMIAVVATLAAAAALGRDAFVALPDVKPITAMTLVVGYALGSLPGFTVGAVGMLASNVALGQGPYTPWQMAAWGLVGLFGAALGRLSRRRLGRVSLALACAVAALCAKEIMNLYTWTLGASHTPAALLVAVGQGLPYDVVDVVASFLFGLAFAPELARLLGRMRERMDVRWEAAGEAAGAGALALLLAVVLAGTARVGEGAVSARAATTAARISRVAWPASPSSHPAGAPGIGNALPTARTSRAQTAREVAFLASAQNTDGGFGAARGQRTSELYSAWAALGLAAAGRSPRSVVRDGRSVLNALYSGSATLEGPGDEERTIMALHACGVTAGSLGPRNLLGELLRSRASDGSFEHLVNITTFAIFALRDAEGSASGSLVRAAGAWVARQQNANGGFGFGQRGGASDVDDTAAALQGLVDASVGGATVSRAVSFLLRAQSPDGGYPQMPGGESNAQSTAWAVQGLLAAGVVASGVHRHGSRSPLGYLEGLLAPDGSVRYSATSAQTPVWVTAQALTALAGARF